MGVPVKTVEQSGNWRSCEWVKVAVARGFHYEPVPSRATWRVLGVTLIMCGTVICKMMKCDDESRVMWLTRFMWCSFYAGISSMHISLFVEVVVCHVEGTVWQGHFLWRCACQLPVCGFKTSWCKRVSGLLNMLLVVHILIVWEWSTDCCFFRNNNHERLRASSQMRYMIHTLYVT